MLPLTAFTFLPYKAASSSHSVKVGVAAAGETVLPLVTESGNVFTYRAMSETQARRCICIPQAKNEAAVDAVLQPCTGLQVTRNRTHGSKAIGIRKLIDSLEDKANANVTFCVPVDLFDDYPKQAVEGPLDSQKYPFQQFAIAIAIEMCRAHAVNVTVVHYHLI